MSPTTNSDHITLNTPTRVPNPTLQQTSSPDITTVSNTLYNRTLWTTQHALSSDHLPIITTINIRHDYNKPDGLSLTIQESCLDTIHGRHIVRFRSDQHTHSKHNFYKHHTGGRQEQHTKAQDAQQMQALTPPHSMQNHTKKQHKEIKHL